MAVGVTHLKKEEEEDLQLWQTCRAFSSFWKARKLRYSCLCLDVEQSGTLQEQLRADYIILCVYRHLYCY